MGCSWFLPSPVGIGRPFLQPHASSAGGKRKKSEWHTKRREKFSLPHQRKSKTQSKPDTRRRALTGDYEAVKKVVATGLESYFVHVTNAEKRQRVTTLMDAVLALRLEQDSVLVDFQSPRGMLGLAAALFYECRRVVVFPEHEGTREFLQSELPRYHELHGIADRCVLADALPRGQCRYAPSTLPLDMTHLAHFYPLRTGEWETLWTLLTRDRRFLVWGCLVAFSLEPELPPVNTDWMEVASRHETDQSDRSRIRVATYWRHLPDDAPLPAMERQEDLLSGRSVAMLDSSPLIQVRKSEVGENAGMGGFAMVEFQKGDWIVPYRGFVVPPEDIDVPGYDQAYVLEWEKKHFVDARFFLGGKFNDASPGVGALRKGTNAVFATRPGKPKLGIPRQPWLRATQRIPVGKEILVSYGAEYWDPQTHLARVATYGSEEEEEEGEGDSDE